MRSELRFPCGIRPLASAAALVAALMLAACGLLPERPNYPQAPLRVDAPPRNFVRGLSTPCAKIHWQNLGAARDINQAIILGGGEGTLTDAAYGPRPAAMQRSAEAESRGKPFDPALLRSERSVALASSFPDEYRKAYLQAIEHWLQEHLAVELSSCP